VLSPWTGSDPPRSGAPRPRDVGEAQEPVTRAPDAPLDMTAELRGHLVARDCPFPEVVVKLEGHALRWRIVTIGAP